MLKLDENHVYHLGTEILPGTTQILGEYIRTELYGEVWWVHTPTGAAIADHIMQRAAEIGTAIHKIAFYVFTGAGIDIKSLSPTLLAPYEQIFKFVQQYKPQVILCEVPLHSQKYRYAGTLDLFAKLKGFRKPVLVDIKTGMSHLVGPQTASYEHLVHENKYRGNIERTLLRIPKDGSEYTFTPLRRRDDWNYFYYRLQNYNWLQKAA